MKIFLNRTVSQISIQLTYIVNIKKIQNSKFAFQLVAYLNVSLQRVLMEKRAERLWCLMPRRNKQCQVQQDSSCLARKSKVLGKFLCKFETWLLAANRITSIYIIKWEEETSKIRFYL